LPAPAESEVESVSITATCVIVPQLDVAVGNVMFPELDTDPFEIVPNVTACLTYAVPEVDTSFVNVPASTHRLSDGTTIFVPSEEVFVGDVEEYYRLGGLRPRSRPPEKDESGRYINPDKPRSATPEAIAKHTDPATGKEYTVTGNKFTEMLGGLKAGVSRSKADVETENLARAAGVSVDTYKGMSAYERSEALGGGGGAADDRERQAFQNKQQKLIASGGDVETAFAAEIAGVDRKERRDFINNLKEDYLRAIG